MPDLFPLKRDNNPYPTCKTILENVERLVTKPISPSASSSWFFFPTGLVFRMWWSKSVTLVVNERWFLRETVYGSCLTL